MTKIYKETALVTGASGGIGYELALLFARHGIDVILVARSQARLEEIKKNFESWFPINVSVYVADLSEPEAPKALYQFCRDNELVVDYLVNNAGFGLYQKLSAGSAEKYMEMINLNIGALTVLTTLFVKDMTWRGSGRILNVGSTAGYQSLPMLAVYGSSKAYVLHFTEALHAELKGSGVTATVLNPGLTRTGFLDRASLSNSVFGRGSQMSPEKVAKAGYDGLMKGRLNVVPGIINRILTTVTSLTPSRRLLLAVASFIMREHKEEAPDRRIVASISNS